MAPQTKRKATFQIRDKVKAKAKAKAKAKELRMSQKNNERKRFWIPKMFLYFKK